MARLPELRAALVADHAQMTGDGKVTLLGLYGVAPNVEIHVPRFPATIGVAVVFLLAEATDEELPDLTLSIQGPSGYILKDSSIKPEQPPTPGRSVTFAFNLQGIIAEHEGQFKVTVNDGNESLEASFRVKWA